MSRKSTAKRGSNRIILIIALLCLGAVALYRPSPGPDVQQLPHGEVGPPSMVEGYPCDGWIYNTGTLVMTYVVRFANNVEQTLQVVIQNETATIYLDGKMFDEVEMQGGLTTMMVEDVKVALLAVYPDDQTGIYVSDCLLGMIIPNTPTQTGPTLQPLFPTSTPGVTT